MRKKLSAVANSLGIVIEKPILELLNLFSRLKSVHASAGGEYVHNLQVRLCGGMDLLTI